MVITSCIMDPHDMDEADNTQYSAAESFHYAMSSTAYSQLKIQGINGIIEIIGVSQLDSIVILGEKKVESESQTDAQEHLEDITISLETINDCLLIKTIQPSQSNGRDYLVYYIITVPDSFLIDTQLINGETEVSSIKNLVSSYNTNGEITLRSIRGKIMTGITNGIVSVDDLQGSVNASAVNGSIQAQLTLPDSGWCDLSTINGNIGLSIPQTTSAIFQAATVNGIVSVSNLTLTNSSFSQTLVTGILGAGRGSVSLEAVNGNISASGD